MIIAKAKTDKGDIVIVGLSEGNITQLKDGKPALTEIPGTDIKIAVMYGKTEAAIYKELEKSGLKMPIPEIRKGMGKQYDL
jgi:hypothetical protein